MQTLHTQKTETETKLTKNKITPLFHSIKEIANSDYGEMFFAVEDMIPEGLTIVSAPPKTGKSWLMLDLCAAVASGKPFLGRNVMQGNTVYFDFENSDRSIQKRINDCRPEIANLDSFVIVLREDITKMAAELPSGASQFPTVDNGFLDILNAYILSDLKPKLIVIDTLRFIQGARNRTETDYAADYRTAAQLKAVADKHHISLVVITHSTKLTHPDDPQANISGSVGAPGAADCNLIICKEKRFSSDAILSITGRSIPASQRKLKFDSTFCVWTDEGEHLEDDASLERAMRIEKYKASPIRAAVIKLTELNPEGWRGRASELITAAAKKGINILDSAKEVGYFLTTMIPLFNEFDKIKISRIQNGNAGKIYKCTAWTEEESVNNE